MSIEVSDYETKSTTWREEFEKAYVDWVDLELISVLLTSIDSSIRYLCIAVNDTTRWPSRINKSLRTVSYHKIRDAADFLGIPPWFLFNHNEKNTRIQELFNNTDTSLKPIELPYFSEYNIEPYYDFLDELTKRVTFKSKEDFQFLSEQLFNLQKSRSYHDVIIGNWKAVYSFFNDIHRDFAGGATFSYRDPDGILKGNMRVNFQSDHQNKRRLIKSGWLSLKIKKQNDRESATIKNFINTVVTDMEWIFDQKPWTFDISSADGATILLTWHTLRTSNDQFKLVSSLINRQLSEANFKMNIGEKINGVTSAFLESSNPFEEFLQIIKSDVKTTEEAKLTRRRNSLQLLYDRGIIHNGDAISLLYSNKTSGPFHNELITKATIIIDNGKPMVRWEYNKEVYSISKLTQIILVEITQQTNLIKHHLNGTKYWTMSGKDKSLFAMANDVYKLDKTS